MTKSTKIILVAILALTVAVPVFGRGPGGGGMMGDNYNQNTQNSGQSSRGHMMGGNYNQNMGPGQFSRGHMMGGNYNQNMGPGPSSRGHMMGGNYNQNMGPGQSSRGNMRGGNYNQNMGPGQSSRGNMMGGFNRNQGYNNQNTNLTEDQVTQLNDLQKKFNDDTAGLRDQMLAKSNELNTTLNSADPDADKVKALQAELNDLRTQMSNARVDYDLEAKKINPDGFGSRGTGLMMGRSGGMGSFAPGVCF